MDINDSMLSMVYTFSNKRSSGFTTSGEATKIETMLNQQLAKELHKPIVRKFEKGKEY